MTTAIATDRESQISESILFPGDPFHLEGQLRLWVSFLLANAPYHRKQEIVTGNQENKPDSCDLFNMIRKNISQFVLPKYCEKTLLSVQQVYLTAAFLHRHDT